MDGGSKENAQRMGQGFLIDTNVIVHLTGSKLPSKIGKRVAALLEDNPIISVVNKIELLSYPSAPIDFSTIIDEVTVLHLDDEIIEQTIEIRRKYRIKLPDAIIAATCIVHQLTLLTDNIKDFRKIDGLEILEPSML